MDFYYLIFTSACASLDSIPAGIAFGADGKDNVQQRAAGIIAVVFATCLFSFAAAGLLSPLYGRLGVYVGGIILIALGLFGYINNLKPRDFVRKRGANAFYCIILPGLGVGADGACAVASLTMMGFGISSVIAATAFHYFFLQLGILIANKGYPRALQQSLSPSILIALGLLKLLQ